MRMLHPDISRGHKKGPSQKRSKSMNNKLHQES
jgi:hypothetical protein